MKEKGEGIKKGICLTVQIEFAMVLDFVH